MAPTTGRWDIPVPALREDRLRSLAQVSGGTLPMLFVPPSQTDVVAEPPRNESNILDVRKSMGVSAEKMVLDSSVRWEETTKEANGSVNNTGPCKRILGYHSLQ